MSGMHHLTARHSPPVRKTASKAARSAPSTRTTVTPKITIKAARAKPAKSDDDPFHGDDDEMATSFLQYCAMCEKQIVVPNNSILYCSESCRRRDASPPAVHPFLSLALANTNRMPARHPKLSDPSGETLPRYVAALQPTPRDHLDARIRPIDHEGKSDLDPTEWKPAEMEQDGPKSPPFSQDSGQISGRKSKLQHHPSSEASDFLSRFHISSDDGVYKYHPGWGQSQSTFTRTTPPLSHTPSSSEDSLVGTPYEFVTRPVISMPTTSATDTVLEGDKVTMGGERLNYEKQTVGSGLGSASGSLKRLLGTRTVEP